MAKKDKFIEPYEVPNYLWILQYFLCHQFDCKFVCFVLVVDSHAIISSGTVLGGATMSSNAMMNRSREILLRECSLVMKEEAEVIFPLEISYLTCYGV